jgi:phosphoribosylaminoimidazole-succinocarboxamide synthase
MGSVKDLTLLESPQLAKPGVGFFEFSDRYSVFDWGEMPDTIENKGKALCIMSAYFFEKLEAMGIKTHYLGIVEDGKVKKLSEAKNPAHAMKVKLVRVVRPELSGNVFNYSVFQKEKGNFLIPLEVIYRNSLPDGASVFKRLKDGGLTLQEIGLDQMPVPGQKLDKPILDVSTKLEKIDRYISWNEAKNISGLKNGELEEVHQAILTINHLITQEAERVGLVNEDGKVEFAYDENRKLMLVDVLGTPDECRFTYGGLPVSKEVARIYYRKSAWYNDVEEAKKKDKVNWKELVKTKPEPLPLVFHKLISQLYQACANEITRKTWFQTPPLKEILNGIRDFLKLA